MAVMDPQATQAEAKWRGRGNHPTSRRQASKAYCGEVMEIGK